MNFKPTLWKTIISMIGGIIGYININNREIREYNVNGLEYIINATLMEQILFVIIPIILIYLIWSLFQKKK